MPATPTADLRRVLDRLEINAAAVAAAEREVTRRARGLPRFDSIWIDVFLRRGLLTAFQADALHSGRADELFVGPYRLTGRLSPTRGATFAAAAEDGTAVAIKRVRGEASGKLADARPCEARPHAVGPDRFDRLADGVCAVSPLIAGPNLRELLARFGRLSPPAVIAIARQIAAELSVGPPHGQLTPENIRITPDGRAICVDRGYERLVAPEGRPDRMLEPDVLATLDPHRFGRRTPHRETHDVYAFAAALFELLTGRPTHAQADPFARIAAKKSHPAPDVATLVGDGVVPESLVTVINAGLAIRVEDRPAGFAAVSAEIGPPTATDARRLAAITTRGRTALSRLFGPEEPPRVKRRVRDEPNQTTRNAVLATAAAGLFATALWLTADLRPTNRVTAETVTERFPPGRPSETNTDGPRGLSWPRPDPRGVVTFTSPGPYRAAEIEWARDLTLIAADGVRPVIRIGDRPIRLTARRVMIDGIDLYGDAGAPALALVRSQTLNVRNVRAAAAGRSRPSGIAWRRRDGDPAGVAELRIDRSAFAGLAAAVHLADRPAGLDAVDTLFLDCDRAVRAVSAVDRPWRLRLSRVTCRDCSAVAGVGAATGIPRVVAANSLFGLSEDAPFIDQSAEPGRKPTAPAGITASDSLIDKRVQPAGLPETGLLPGEIIFTSDPESVRPGLFPDFAAAAAFRFVGPRRAGVAVGVTPDRMTFTSTPSRRDLASRNGPR